MRKNELKENADGRIRKCSHILEGSVRDLHRRDTRQGIIVLKGMVSEKLRKKKRENV